MADLQNSKGRFDGSVKDYRPIHRLIVLLACLTVLLLVAGALVTSNEAGDSVPDWPMSFGRWLLFGSRQFVGNVRYEYSHRFLAGAVGSVTLLAAVLVWSREKLRGRFGWLVTAALLGVIFQAGLGGIRVLFPAYKAPIAIVHAFVAQSFFCLVVTLALITSKGWNEFNRLRSDRSSSSLTMLSGATVALVMVQLILGAGFRHGILPIGWHIGGAVTVLLFVSATAIRIYKDHSDYRYLMRPSLAMIGLLICQIGLGIGAYVARLSSLDDPQPLEPMISLTVAHVVVGALTLASVLVVALRCYQVLGPQTRAERIDVSQAAPGFGPA